jgi:hypothetical protein
MSWIIEVVEVGCVPASNDSLIAEFEGSVF